MCELDVARDLLGEKIASYLANKHRGGQNGRKGTVFEDWYAAYHLAKQIYLHIVEGNAESVCFEGQCVAFVDDLAVYRVESTEFYQLKNAGALSWLSGDHPLSEDFRMQVILSKAVNQPDPVTMLVCSDDAVAEQMEGSVPDSIEAHTQVEHFPYDASESTYAALTCNSLLRDAIARISRHDGVEATVSNIGNTFDILLGAWRSLGVGRHSIESVINSCMESQPAAFRLAVSDEEIRARLPVEFADVLDSVPGLSYGIVRGYFVWSYSTASGRKLSSGSPRYSCCDREFEHFCDRVLERRPSTIDELEELL
ncbi:hypothetical protein DB032_20630 [Chromobacterium sp. Panama]|uniref:hypothetical protein n=1 Tax=Chromobacterium sp. Panama TaxID=2161826 RepID=UPI000D3097F7|nr:hypothetical protein [Chromobacterium sp. Panama]PTU67161.1 hypothetical protein DB032_20630 [Chromobacterium sp. Panama]